MPAQKVPRGVFGFLFSVALVVGAVWLFTQTDIGADIANQLQDSVVGAGRSLIEALTSWAH